MKENSSLFNKNFVLVLLGQIISLFGNAIIRFALPLYIFSITGSSTLYGTVMAASMIPMIIISPIGGIIADRVNKRNIMVILDFATAALLIIFTITMEVADAPIIIIGATMMILYGIQAAYQPAVQASIPVLVIKENLLPANALINQVNAISSLLGPVIGGILFSSFGLMPIIIIGGICFLFSATMELFIRIPFTKQKASSNVLHLVKNDLSESIHFVSKEKPVILKCVLVVAAFNLFLSSMLMIGFPPIILKTLGMNNEMLGYAQGALAAGSLFGGIMTGVLAKKLSIAKAHILLFASALSLLPTGNALILQLGAIPTYVILLICSFLFTSIATMFTIQALSFVQMETPTHLIGKVISCVMAIAMCSQPVGQAIYGILFDVLEKTPYFILFFAVIVSCTISLSTKKIFSNLKSS